MRALVRRVLVAAAVAVTTACGGAATPPAGDPATESPPDAARPVEPVAVTDTTAPSPERAPESGPAPASAPTAAPVLGPVAPADAGPIAAPFLESRSSPPRHVDAVPDGKNGWLACDAALTWLVRHQSTDGSWRGGAASARCADERCATGTDASFVVGDTSLAVVALCATGWHESHGRAIREGVEFLLSVQAADGSFRGPTASHRVLDQALATEALCRAVGEESPAAHREAAHRAAACLLSLRAPGGVWTDPCGGTTCGLRTTAWATMALADARLVGFETPTDVYRDVLAWLDAGPCGANEEAAVMRTCCRIFCGTTRRNPRLLADHAILTQAGASGGTAAETFDAGVRYLATVAEFYWGGDVWARRRTYHADAILPRQRKRTDGCLVGSWDAGERQGPEGGRVAATALTSMLFDAAYISTYRNAMADRPLIPE